MSTTHESQSKHSHGHLEPGSQHNESPRSDAPPQDSQESHGAHHGHCAARVNRAKLEGIREVKYLFGYHPKTYRNRREDEDEYDSDLSADSEMARSDISSSDGRFDDQHAGAKTIRDIKKALRAIVPLRKHYGKPGADANGGGSGSDSDDSERSVDPDKVEEQQMVHGLKRQEDGLRDLLKRFKRRVRGGSDERDSSPSSSTAREPPPDRTTWKNMGIPGRHDDPSSEDGESEASSRSGDHSSGEKSRHSGRDGSSKRLPERAKGAHGGGSSRGKESRHSSAESSSADDASSDEESED
ncbi:MAG: hypothetical protein Q9159_001496 [Coniocarpon cinnabarinum]